MGADRVANRTCESLVLDGSHGEGGGQILRTALSLSAITGRPVRIENIRASRRNPGLAAQHLTAIRASAAICGADVGHGELGSKVLEFDPGKPPAAGNYRFDVAEAREGGSAGAATLVLQTVALPLALARGASSVSVQGGTHVPWSPSFDYLRDVWLETLRGMGIDCGARLDAWGFYPIGGGGITMEISGGGNGETKPVRPLTLTERGALLSVEGRGVAANLPAHIAQRMADRARALLEPLGVPVTISPERVRAASPGAGLFLTARYARAVAGFGAFGRLGKPAEIVAEEAVARLLEHHRGGAAFERHLGDQMLLPLSLARGRSEFTCEAATKHIQSNAWVIEQFGLAKIDISYEGGGSRGIRVAVQP